MWRERNIRTTLQATFFTEFENRGLFFAATQQEKRAQLSYFIKKRGFKGSSNISFTLNHRVEDKMELLYSMWHLWHVYCVTSSKSTLLKMSSLTKFMYRTRISACLKISMARKFSKSITVYLKGIFEQ